MAPDDPQAVTVGEIYRLMQGLITDVKTMSTQFTSHQADVQNKHRDLIDRVQAMLGPMGEMRVKINRLEDDVNKLGAKHDTDVQQVNKKVDTIEAEVKSVVVNAAKVSGAIGMAAFIGSMLPWPWKHP